LAISNQRYLTSLSKVSFSKFLPEKDLSHILNSCEILSLKAGDIVFSEKSFQETMYVILEGKLEVHKQNNHIAFRGVGEFFGEMALLESEPRSANVRAVSEAILLEVNKDIFSEFLGSNPKIIWDIAKTLSQRIRQDNEALERTNLRLRKNEEKLHRILDLVSDLVFQIDPNGIIIFVNKPIKTLGYEVDELIGKPFEEICEGKLDEQQKFHILAKRVGARSLVEKEFSLKVDPSCSMHDFASSVTYLISACGLWDIPNEKVLEKTSEKNFMGSLLIARSHLLDLNL